jgi:hypothetical protein
MLLVAKVLIPHSRPVLVTTTTGTDFPGTSFLTKYPQKSVLHPFMTGDVESHPSLQPPFAPCRYGLLRNSGFSQLDLQVCPGRAARGRSRANPMSPIPLLRLAEIAVEEAAVPKYAVANRASHTDSVLLISCEQAIRVCPDRSLPWEQPLHNPYWINRVAARAPVFAVPRLPAFHIKSGIIPCFHGSHGPGFVRVPSNITDSTKEDGRRPSTMAVDSANRFAVGAIVSEP